MAERYHSYTEYKDSEDEWIGKYPSNWNITRVKFESYVKARVGWHGLKSDDFTDEGPYLVTGSDFKGPKITWNDCYHCDLERYEQDPYIQLQNGDLLVTKDGTIGKVALVSDLDRKATLNSGVFVVRPLTSSYTSKFYFWLLQSNVFTGFVDFNKTGSTIVHLYQDTFVNFKYAMPGFTEQTQIANFLDQETSKIDTLIEKQQQLIKLLKEKRQAVISHAVTKGLNPDALMKDSGVEWLGEVPEHWAVKRLKNVLMESMKNGLFKKKDQFGTGSLLVNVSDLYVDDYFIKLNSLDRVVTTAEEQKIYKVEIGDIFFVRSSLKLEGIGRSACLLEEHEDVVFECHVVKARPSKISTTSKYLVRYLNSPLASQEFIRRSKTTTMTTIDQDNLTTINVVVPPRNEQVLIDSYLDRQLMKIDQADSLAKESMKLYIERRKALISATVTGKIDVRNWKLPEQNKTNKEGTV